jgi:hypothetical protein
MVMNEFVRLTVCLHHQDDDQHLLPDAGGRGKGQREETEKKEAINCRLGDSV